MAILLIGERYEEKMGTAYYYVDSATCLANASGLTALCQTLKEKGVITDQELEIIRHEQLQKIDEVLVAMNLPKVVAELLEHRRETIEEFWCNSQRKTK